MLARSLSRCFSVKHPSNLAESKQLLNAPGKLAVAWFSATWCGPCKAVTKQVEQLAEKSPNVNVVKIDIDELGDLAAEYNVISVPTFHFLKEGKVVDTVVGANADAVKKNIAKHQ